MSGNLCASVDDYGINFRFEDNPQLGISNDNLIRAILEKLAPQTFPPYNESTSSSDSSGESSDSDDFYPPLETHTCRVYKCNDPDCFSCDLVSECYNCSHCWVNRSLQTPCLDCGTPDFHPVGIHQEIRCSYHRRYPQPLPHQFNVSHDPKKVVQGQFQPLCPEETKRQTMLKNKDKIAKYLAWKKQKKSTKLEESLLANVVHGTFSQCEIGPDFKPTLDWNMDTSRFEEKIFQVPAEIAMPRLRSMIPPQLKEKSNPGLATTVSATEQQVCIVETEEEHIIPREPRILPKGGICCCSDGCDMKSKLASEGETVACVLCEKYHPKMCSCYKLQGLVNERKAKISEVIDVLVDNHKRACLDMNCPLRNTASPYTNPSIWEWFGSLSALERLKFQCPLNVEDYSCGQLEAAVSQLHCSHLDDLARTRDSVRHTYISNFLPRPLKPNVKRKDCVPLMKFWDRLNLFQEEFYDHKLAIYLSMIRSFNNPVFDDTDVEVRGRYDDIYKYWDRNDLFFPKKILVKKPESLVKLIETDDLALRFEALHALNKSTRVSKTLQVGCGQIKVIQPLINVLDNCDHDGIRRMAIYLLALATTQPPGRCVFFELGSQAMANIYHHYLTDGLYAMRRAYMMLASNILQDTGACAVFSNTVTFEKTFANMCDKDPDFQMYLMRTLYFALQDIEGREKILSLPEFRLTPVLSGCISKKPRVREYALDLLDIIVSVCKQEVVMKTFKDLRGISILKKILRKGYMTYAHPVVLKMYEKIADDPAAAPALKEGSLANLMEFVETVDDPKLISKTLQVLVKMARDPMTKEILALTNVITKVAPLLVHTNEDLAQSVLKIIELMAAKGSRNLITQQLVKADPMVDLLWVVGSENRGWDTRVIALRCIIALLNLSPYFGECYIKCKNATNVINLLCHQAKFLTTYSKTLLVQVISVLAKSKRNFEFLIRNKAIKALVYSFKCFDSFESQLYSHSIGLLAYMMKDRRAVTQFSNVKNSWNLIAKKFMEKKFISADILMNLLFFTINLTDNYELGAKMFINNGFLNWLISLVDIYPEMSGSIKNAIDSIIFNNLPLKFAHHGFLNYQDITNRSFFFATREPYNLYSSKIPFPNFEKGISNKLKPKNAIYYFNLPPLMRSKSMEDSSNPLEMETSDNFDLYTTVSRSADSVQKTVEEEEIFIELEEDSKLGEMFDLAKLSIARFNEENPPTEIREERLNQVNGLASAVVRFMEGYDPQVPVTMQIQEIYLESLKKSLTTNVHPFGRIVLGHKFERAVLFKVLADILDIPCWLKRQTDKTSFIAWVEVDVASSTESTSPQAEELRPSHVVDLMSPIPQLLPLRSSLAKKYMQNVD